MFRVPKAYGCAKTRLEKGVGTKDCEEHLSQEPLNPRGKMTTDHCFSVTPR